MNLREKMLVKKNNRQAMVRICNHCGGMLRHYRGSHTCLMCGRDVDHSCEKCSSSNQLLVKSA